MLKQQKRKWRMQTIQKKRTYFTNKKSEFDKETKPLWQLN